MEFGVDFVHRCLALGLKATAPTTLLAGKFVKCFVFFCFHSTPFRKVMQVPSSWVIIALPLRDILRKFSFCVFKLALHSDSRVKYDMDCMNSQLLFMHTNMTGIKMT
jgi:hypothetical protein